MSYFSSTNEKDPDKDNIVDMREEKPGKFFIRYQSGIIYVGEAQDGIREGFGHQRWPDGAKY